MVKLTSVHGSFAAHVLAARLADEGLDVEVRGVHANPYGLTVGDIAVVDLYVPADQADDASYVLLASEIDEVLELPSPRRGRPATWRVAAALVVLGLAVAPPLLRLVNLS
jgi:hypothetical protein